MWVSVRMHQWELKFMLFSLLILNYFSFVNFVVLTETFVAGGVHSSKRTRVLFSKSDKSYVPKLLF